MITRALVIGIGATALVDLWNFGLRRAFYIRSLDFCHLGRWVSYVPAGVYRHEPISATPTRRFECSIGWAAHYSIGALLSVAFLLVAPANWLGNPTVLPAIGFGALTVVLPLFVLQPALGLGVAASRAPSPSAARLKSIVTHVVYGLGLWLAAVTLLRL